MCMYIDIFKVNRPMFKKLQNNSKTTYLPINPPSHLPGYNLSLKNLNIYRFIAPNELANSMILFINEILNLITNFLFLLFQIENKNMKNSKETS